MPISDAIDCDIHPGVPTVKALLPYMTDYWRESFIARGQDGFQPASYLPNSPLTCRPDWRDGEEIPGTSFERLKAHALDGFGSRFAICNVLYGGSFAVSETMGAALCSAVNDWIREQWLDRDPRLRASIVVPTQNPALAVEEIERQADDPRFVQILMPVGLDMMLGKQHYWPIFEAAVRHRLPIGLHAGSLYRYAPTAVGWPSHHLQDYVSNNQAFESQLLSLIAQGVFVKFPDLMVVLIESGVTWLPGFLWRARKTWRAVRPEVPWVKESPIDIIRRHVRLTAQPIDAPDNPEILERVLEQIGSDDMLLFASDYPHWQFDGDQMLPKGVPARLIEKMAKDNPLATYPRLRETLQ
ncbi:amidohydrolase family protein [Rhizobium mayense]|uniref:Amidohydrolase family protein n=1 Tax=Rhizobium mayense TaxID=1312184 RepID=A0ABT7K1J8_9HYPH|nr:amidohydrolase family protein [Rhizobium mayense]MDL2401870.1 amidohydrolase family protein [Rhizobium mayense]